jgi:hypothetical protein
MTWYTLGMSSIREVNLTFFYFLIFTIISSALAYHIALAAYDTFFEISMGTWANTW